MRIVRGRSIAHEVAKLANRRLLFSADTERAVARIINDVCKNGDTALRRYAKKWDGLAPKQSLRVSENELKSALASIPSNLRHALETAAHNIRKFAEWQKPQEFTKEIQSGLCVGQIIRPIDSVGCYVPGGRYPLPSSLLMTVIPAQVAGVARIVVCSPRPAQETLAAAALVGVTEFYRAGGAQAIAALAYGTKSITAVVKIVGPGNRFVTTAKKLVSFDCAIDMLAGPTEAIVIAEDGDPAFWASDLIAQAEHDPDTSVVFVTSKAALGQQVAAELKVRSKTNAIARESLSHNGVIFVTNSRAESIEVANAIASEHITLSRDQLGSLLSAGSIFLGPYSPQSLGDYAAGPNHVLPTAGAARYRGGLSVLDYVKIITVQEVSREALVRIAPVVTTLAEAEGLQAHAESVRVRCSRA
ncbi:MAG TPA: histidinol dehydrogenase [Terriglobales bacterium]|nr:histidinol dehydrogenase [Terriglobales bacterium]